MKKFARTLVQRNYKKRFISIVIAGLLLAAVSVTALALTMREQLSALRGVLELEDAEEPAGSAESEKDGIEHRIKAALRAIPHPGRAAKLAVLLSFLAFAVLGVIYWVSVAEWLYKEAVIHGLNRALWPMLGCIFNLLAVMALLVVINEPSRVTGEVSA